MRYASGDVALVAGIHCDELVADVSGKLSRQDDSVFIVVVSVGGAGATVLALPKDDLSAVAALEKKAFQRVGCAGIFYRVSGLKHECGEFFHNRFYGRLADSPIHVRITAQ